MFFTLYMLRQTPSYSEPSPKWLRIPFLFLSMATIVLSVIFEGIMAAIILDSFGPNGSYISTYFSNDDVLIHILGQLLVKTLGVTALVTSSIVCLLFGVAAKNWWGLWCIIVYYIVYFSVEVVCLAGWRGNGVKSGRHKKLSIWRLGRADISHKSRLDQGAECSAWSMCSLRIQI